jgi:CO dehydrogenase nickel-insertion accessory protein CooC1
LTDKLALRVGRQFMILNNTGENDREALDRASRIPVEVLGIVPPDEGLQQLSRYGEPLTRLPLDSPARRAVKQILEAALFHEQARTHKS